MSLGFITGEKCLKFVIREIEIILVIKLYLFLSAEDLNDISCQYLNQQKSLLQSREVILYKSWRLHCTYQTRSAKWRFSEI